MHRTQAWLIYGATGFTGRLLARAARDLGLRPTLAGRSRAAIEPLGRELGCETRAITLDDPRLTRALEGFACVLSAAGPFAETTRPLLDACLAARCHYLDLSGELDALAMCYARHHAALARGIAVVPAVGWSVVPMDCLAALLAEGRERPVALELAFEGYEPSAGTAKTYARSLRDGGTRRQAGRLVRAPLRWELVSVPFKRGPQRALRVAYGELESCYRSAEIPDISVCMVPPPALSAYLKYGSRLSPLLRFTWLRRAVEREAARRFTLRFAADGGGATQIWGRMLFADGAQRQGFLETGDPYRFSVQSALAALQHVLNGEVRSGAWTPSQAFGPRFTLEVDGCSLELAEVAA